MTRFPSLVEIPDRVDLPVAVRYVCPPMEREVVVLENEQWQVGVLPETGASIAFARVHVGGRFLDLLRPTPRAFRHDVSECGSYVLAPWSNRIRSGRFEYRGKTYDVGVNSSDDTAIHGVAKDVPWSVAKRERSSVSLSLASKSGRFPWAFSMELSLVLTDSRLSVTTSIRNEDASPFPAGFGHHPFFMRALSGLDDEVVLEVPCAEYYTAPDCLPSGPSVPVEPRVDFRTPRPLGSTRVDDCLTGRLSNAPVRLQYPRSEVAVTMACDPLYSHIVLYIPERDPFFAVEPVTHSNDAFNLAARGVATSGAFELAPGEERSATFTLDVR